MARRLDRRSSLRAEVLAGRTLAACVHPRAAWQSDVRSFRIMLLAGYFAAGYVSVLLTMVLLN